MPAQILIVDDNAALTVLRHYDSATVVKGFVGGAPKTGWVVGYSLLERIHYLLVAGFDVFGNVGHQLTTRMYMDFLRMEGEYNFLLLLPPARRRQLGRLCTGTGAPARGTRRSVLLGHAFRRRARPADDARASPGGRGVQARRCAADHAIDADRPA